MVPPLVVFLWFCEETTSRDGDAGRGEFAFPLSVVELSRPLKLCFVTLTSPMSCSGFFLIVPPQFSACRLQEWKWISRRIRRSWSFSLLHHLGGSLPPCHGSFSVYAGRGCWQLPPTLVATTPTLRRVCAYRRDDRGLDSALFVLGFSGLASV